MSRRKAKPPKRPRIASGFKGRTGMYQENKDSVVLVDYVQSGKRKISELLLDLVRDEIDEASELDRESEANTITATVDLAVVAWNTSVIAENTPDSSIEDILEEEDIAEELKDYIADIANRKQFVAPNDDRFIVDYEVSEDFGVRVANVPFNELSDELIKG